MLKMMWNNHKEDGVGSPVGKNKSKLIKKLVEISPNSCFFLLMLLCFRGVSISGTTKKKNVSCKLNFE